VHLIGVDAPTGDECYADKATSKLRGSTRGTILLEKDGMDSNRGDLARYVWVRKDDGTLSMVNRNVLVGGYGEFDHQAPISRFAGWLQMGADAAKEKGSGLWAGCAEPASETPTPSAATPRPELAGTYSGTTVEGWPISLTVGEEGVTGYKLEFS
jgi:hypothetical protein